MKKTSVLFSLFLAIIIIACSSDPIGLDNPKDSGKILLKIDKQNAPESVVFVKAYLTRENHQPIVGTLNLQSDSTADILLDNINAGEWHLKVDAEDDSGLVLYTGETDVQIFAGFTSQVYLTLGPTGSGTGSIYISVNWGVPINNSWIDYYNNPVLSPLNNSYDNQGISQTKVYYDGTKYMMWYLGLSSGRGYTLYAESQDGINWIRPVQTPVLNPGPPGSWDSWIAAAGPVIKEGQTYKMYYLGYNDPYGQYGIGLATSLDGKVWQKNPDPVMYGTSGWERQIAAQSILKINGLYYMYYGGQFQTGEGKIGLAISNDGINWTKYSGNPILVPTQSWEENGISWSGVILDNSVFKMVYMKIGSTSDAFGYATSIDGKNWIKSEHNPIFLSQNTTNGWAYTDIAYPCLIKTGNEYRVYYSGWNQGRYKIGFMRRPAN